MRMPRVPESSLSVNWYGPLDKHVILKRTCYVTEFLKRGAQ